MSPRAKEVIFDLNHKFSEERSKLNVVKIKKEEMKIKMKFMKNMMNSSVSITFVFIIGLVFYNVLK